MKKYFITGLITLLPFIITLYILVWLIDFLTQPFMGMIKALLSLYEQKGHIALYYHEEFIIFISRISILILLFVSLLLLGFLCQKITKRITINIFSKVPFIPTLYRISKEITKAVFKPGQKTFKESVLVSFPKEEIYALGLVTGEVLPVIKEKNTELEFTVFVPTSPHLLSGYLLMTSKKQTIPVNMTAEEVFKFLLSAGTVHSPNPPTSPNP